MSTNVQNPLDLNWPGGFPLCFKELLKNLFIFIFILFIKFRGKLG